MVKDRHRPGELPWGWWLRVNGNYLEDEQGRRWRSVRAAYWEGELNFPDVHFAPEQHELLLRSLSLIDTRGRGEVESRYELFVGDMMFWRFYMSWLFSIGMLTRTNAAGMVLSPLDAKLSPEGRSVLLMLRATRDPAWEELPMVDVITAVVSSMGGNAALEREKALQTFEDAVGLRRHVFARERIGRSYVITLTSMAIGQGTRMPTRRVTWSLSFDDAIVRDGLFAWIATRIDHWDRWGEIAYHKSAEALTQHLLGLLVASQAAASE